MGVWLNRFAAVLALGAALLAALAGSWREVPFLDLALRASVCAAVVYAFARAGGELAGRAVLRGLAEHHFAGEQKSRSESETGAAGDRKAA